MIWASRFDRGSGRDGPAACSVLATARPLVRQAHGCFRPSENRRAHFACPIGALREDPVELGGVLAELIEARTDRRDQVDDRVRQRRLERAEALASEAGKD